MAQDRLAHAEGVWALSATSIMAERPKPVLLAPEPGLELHDSAFLDAPARSVERCLRIEVVVDEVRDNLEMPLRLHQAAHHAERAEQPSVGKEHAGDDCV